MAEDGQQALIEGLTVRGNATGMIASSMRPKTDQDTYQSHPPSLPRKVSGVIYIAPQFFLLSTGRQSVCHTRRRRGNICLTTRSTRGPETVNTTRRAVHPVKFKVKQ